MKIIARIELAALASLFAIGSASAVPVTGEINIISFNDPSFAINFATNTVSFGAGNNAKVTLATGSYAGLLNATAHYNNFTYDPLSVTDPLWATTSGGPAAQFSLTGISGITENSGLNLQLKGWGVIKVVGFDDTPGTWNFTVNKLETSFSWSSINRPVPDGGSSVALLGASLLVLGGARRFLKK